MDIRTQKVPVRVLQIAIFVALTWQFEQGRFVSAAIAASVGFILLFIPSFVSRGRWMGSGDAWVGAWMGAVLGLPLFWIGLCAAWIFGGLVAGTLLLCGWKRTARVPFVPILCVGAVFAWLFSQTSLPRFFF